MNYELVKQFKTELQRIVELLEEINNKMPIIKHNSISIAPIGGKFAGGGGGGASGFSGNHTCSSGSCMVCNPTQ